MGHVEFLTGPIDRGLDGQEASSAPRSFAYGGGIEPEGGFAPGRAEAARRTRDPPRPQ